MFPTFVRAIPRARPPYRPAGLESCDATTLSRYQAHRYMYPPYQFKKEYLCCNPKKQWVPPNSEIREALMGFRQGHTYNCWTTQSRKQDPGGWELARCSLIGNSFHCPTVAWILGQGLFQLGFLPKPPDVSALANLQKAHSFTTIEVPAPLDSLEDQALALVRMYLTRLSLRGGDVALLGNVASASAIQHKGIDANEWSWAEILNIQWKLLGEHINVLELRAFLLALRWRLRHGRSVGTKFLHLVDSRVILSSFAKGRTSSLRLRKVLSKVNALCLAGDVVAHLGYVRSHLNPADAPSRVTPKSAWSTAFENVNVSSTSSGAGPRPMQ